MSVFYPLYECWTESPNVLITTDEQLRAFADRASCSRVLAVDTEFMREKVYHPKLCLIQLGTDGEQVAVDPFAISDVSPIVRLFQNPFITKVFHACSQDMEVLLGFCGVLPWPLFDTQVATSYVSDRYQIGYGQLVEEHCGVSLPKTESLTDWTRRPLDAAQIAYALDDVKYLPEVWRNLSASLAEKGRTLWIEPEFRRMADPATYVHDPRNAFWRVKRIGSLSSRRQLAVAREVAAWREERAAAIDKPRRWILSDELIIEVARHTPSKVDDLMRVRGMADVAPGDREQIVEACRAGLACPSSECPEPERHVRPSFEDECVCDLMYALTRMIAKQQGIALSILATRDELMEYVRGGRDASPLVHGWRYEVLGRHLDDLLAGNVGLTIKDGAVELL